MRPSRAAVRGASLAAALLVLVAPAGVRAQAARPAAGAEPPVVVRPAAGPARAVAVVAFGEPGAVVRYVDLAELAGALRGAAGVRGDRARVTAGGVTVDVADGVAFARVAGREVPLAAPARVRDGRALVPLQLVADVLPAALALRFDAGTRTLAAAPAPRPPVDDTMRTVTLPSIIGPPPSASRRADRPAPDPEPSDAAPRAADLPSGDAAVGAGALRGRVVVVDAGHGGIDAGMRGTPAGGPVVVEKDVTLGIARALRSSLAARGLGVVLTRDRDTLVALADRGRIANARRGDVFVSVHVNAANPRWRDGAAVRGFETYFLSEARTDEARDVAARENESVRYEGPAVGGPSDPLGFVVRDLAQNEYLRVSQRLAQAVQRRLGRVHPATGRGVHQAGFKVLVTASMPAVLVEVGYGSNAADAGYITSAAGQRALADAIAEAVVEHLSRYGGANARRP